jgi:hypothetical protein
MTEKDARYLWNRMVSGRYGSRYAVERCLRGGKEKYIQVTDSVEKRVFPGDDHKQVEGRHFRVDPEATKLCGMPSLATVNPAPPDSDNNRPVWLAGILGRQTE